MAIYLMFFFLSTLFFFIVERGKINKKAKKILLFFALLFPILLAGLRKIGIGTDTEVYVNILYDAAKSSRGFFDYLGKEVYSNFQYKPVTNWEIGYNILVFISTKLTGSYQGVLFLTHILIVLLIYGGLKSTKGHHSIYLGMMTFYFLFYGSTLNAMRQWIAVSFLFYGFHFLQNNQLKKYLMTVLAATLFHYSGIIGIILWLVYKYFNNDNNKYSFYISKKKVDDNIFKLLMLAFVGIVILLGLGIIANLLASLNSVFARYVRLYISGTVEIMPMQIIRRLPVLVLLVLNWRKINKISPSAPFLYGMIVLDLLASQLGSIALQSSRIGHFFSVYEIVLLPELVQAQKKKSRLYYFIFLILYYIAGFYYDNVLMGRADIVPYLFFFN